MALPGRQHLLATSPPSGPTWDKAGSSSPTRTTSPTPVAAGRTLQSTPYAIAFPVATQIVRGQIGVPELHQDTLSDPDILRISTNTTLIDDPHLTEISVGKRWAAVTITTTDGRVLESPARTPRGDTDMPLSGAEIATKFHLFADPVVGSDRANEIAQLAKSFDTLDIKDFARLVDLCLSAPASSC